MARIRLLVGQEPKKSPIRFIDPATSDPLVRHLRLYCRLHVGHQPKWVEAIVDTGAPTAVFPLAVWKRFAPHVTWVPFADGAATKPGQMLGVCYQYRLGMVELAVSGIDPGCRLPPVRVVGQFVQPDPAAPDADPPFCLIGLQHGVLRDRFLVVAPSASATLGCEAWLQDDRPAVTASAGP